MTRGADALPGLFDHAAADLDSGGQSGADHRGDGLVGQLVRFRGTNSRQFDRIQFQAVEGPGDLQFLLERHTGGFALTGFSQRHVNDLNGIHSVCSLFCSIFCPVLSPLGNLNCAKYSFA